MTTAVHLQRIDPERNMHRFYSAEIVETLFGEVAVLRCWGRIGTPGRMMQETFPQMDEACRALTKLAAAKQRRGYHAVTT